MHGCQLRFEHEDDKKLVGDLSAPITDYIPSTASSNPAHFIQKAFR